MPSPDQRLPWILFLRAGALGDFILSLPLLRALAATRRPVCLVTRGAYAALLPPDCRVERTLDVDGPAARGLFTATAPLAADAASRTSPPPMTGAHLYAFMRPDEELAAHWRRLDVADVTWLDPRPRQPPHAAARFLMDAGLPVPDQLLTTPLWPPSPRGTDLWIHAGSGSPAKNAPPAVFAEFAEHWLAGRRGAGIVLSFGEADQGIVRPTCNAFERRGLTFCLVDRPPLASLKRLLLERATHYAGNDSGVSHLAAALGIPATVWFRATDPAVWRPLGNCDLRR